jgi:hypothetical protein
MDGSFLGWICFRACGGGGASTSVTFKPLPGDPRSFTATFTVPIMLRRNEGPGNFDPVVAGEYQIHAACVADQQSGCANRSDVSTTFRVSTGLPTVTWQQLPAGQATPVQRLGAMSTSSRSPLSGSQRSVECVGGNLYPHNGELEPRLQLTDDAGRPLPPIIIREGGPLVGRFGNAGCEDVALDPTDPDSYYLIEAPHAGGSERAVAPLPQFTVDGGATWAPLPAPTGFDASNSFVGFSVTTEGVTAWFSRASLEEPILAGEQIRGSFTRDGGKHWTTVEPSCPGGSVTCIWQMRDKPPWIRNGLIRSVDGGTNWNWASFSGSPFAADRVYVLEGSGGRVLEAVGGSPVLYWGFMPLLRSEDGGGSWRWVEVPRPPSDWIETPGAGVVIRLDPDGALMLGTPDGANQTTWYRLARGSTEWERSER